jgi:hypothetical protein
LHPYEAYEKAAFISLVPLPSRSIGFMKLFSTAGIKIKTNMKSYSPTITLGVSPSNWCVAARGAELCQRKAGKLGQALEVKFGDATA